MAFGTDKGLFASGALGRIVLLRGETNWTVLCSRYRQKTTEFGKNWGGLQEKEEPIRWIGSVGSYATCKSGLWLRGGVQTLPPVYPVRPGVHLELIDNLAVEIKLRRLRLLILATQCSIAIAGGNPVICWE